MSHPNFIDDSDWPEVRFINGYAMLIGFLRMGVRGLSVLVFTWATVVLLGGFVSDLEKKDFWCLTMITLIQTFSAGVFDFLLKGDSSHSKNSWKAFLAIAFTMVKDMPLLRKKRRQLRIGSKRRKMVRVCTNIINYFLWAVQLLVLATVLFPLLVVYLVGLYICTGISVWRLIWHASDNANRESNQRPALVVLYLLVVAQCALHSFKALYAWVKGVGLVKEVSDSYSMDNDLVSDYLHETMMGCAKDPTFSRRRNLVTYAVDLLMESKSNDSYLSGVQILGTILELPLWYVTVSGQPDLIKKLLTKSASCGHMIQRLIETMGTESSDSREIREHAAMIVAHIADAISLRYFPGGIQFLSFLLNTVEDYRGPSDGHYDQGSRWQHSRYRGLHKKQSRGRLLERLLLGHGTLDPTSASSESYSNWLVVQGLRIIQNLTADEDNCRIIIGTPRLMSKIVAPLISDQLHRDHHDKWSEVAEELLKLMSRLMATPGERGRELRQEMSGNNNGIISALESITACPKCQVLLIRRVIQILLDLSMDSSYIMDRGSSSIKFPWILLHIFLVPDDCFDKIRGSIHWTKKSSDISRLAGEKLSDLLFPNPDVSAVLLLQSEGDITTMLLSVREVVTDLTGALADAGKFSSRVHAVEILEHLCRHYTSDDEYLKELKKAVVVVMPKVLREILPYEPTKEVIHASLFPDVDLESGVVSLRNAQENMSSSNYIGEQPKSRKLQEALISLCKKIWWEWYGDDDSELTRQLDEAAAKICAEQGKPDKSFPRLLSEAEESASAGTSF